MLEIVKQGYKLEFKTIPVFNGIIQSVVHKNHMSLVKAELDDLLQKKAIETVTQNQILKGFYSALFLVQKKERGNETSHKSKTSKSVSSETSFQNGHNAEGFLKTL